MQPMSIIPDISETNSHSIKNMNIKSLNASSIAMFMLKHGQKQNSHIISIMQSTLGASTAKNLEE